MASSVLHISSSRLGLSPAAGQLKTYSRSNSTTCTAPLPSSQRYTRTIFFALPSSLFPSSSRCEGSVSFSSSHLSSSAEFTSRTSFLAGYPQTSAVRPNPCRAASPDSSNADKGVAQRSRDAQIGVTKLLAILLQAEDVEKTAREHVDQIGEDFFVVSSTYLDMAKKEGNVEVVRKLEVVLKAAMIEKEKTLRAEIQLLNQLLRAKTAVERTECMGKFEEYLFPESYFFQLLNRMLLDVERAQPEQAKLLSQLKTISQETREASKSLKKKAAKN